uniref:Transposase n=1 Tax=Cannabis sativa TaxID=3483 RepID=A0A803Q2J0_CANSA
MIKQHLFFNGIDKSYTKWYKHGERLPVDPTPPSRQKEVRRNREDENWDPLNDMIDDAHYGSGVDPNKFQTLLSDAEKPIYPGCTKYTKLSTLLRLYNLKARHGWSDKCLTDLLSFLKDLLPECNEMPVSFYEAKKTLCSLGMQYEKIHACPNDCVLYRNDFVDAKLCPTCGESRWKKKKNNKGVKEGIPAKVLWYLPPVPRFIRLFRSVEHAKDLTWHANERIKDGKLRHPADTLAWQRVDMKFPAFGPKQPGNNIDVYLAPLIDDLKTLWDEGVNVYDAYKKEEFILRAALLWTINDFPAYGNLSGFTVKGEVLEKMSRITFKLGKPKVGICTKRKARRKAKVTEEPKGMMDPFGESDEEMDNGEMDNGSEKNTRGLNHDE